MKTLMRLCLSALFVTGLTMPAAAQWNNDDGQSVGGQRWSEDAMEERREGERGAIEWERGAGYHEEEWYDPSDWFDGDRSIDYERDWNWGWNNNYGYDNVNDYDDRGHWEADYDWFEGEYEYEYETDEGWFEDWYDAD